MHVQRKGQVAEGLYGRTKRVEDCKNLQDDGKPAWPGHVAEMP